MTVGELREILDAFDEDAEVVVWADYMYYEVTTINRDHNGDVGINWREP
mgnify:CR=1 FL=1